MIGPAEIEAMNDYPEDYKPCKAEIEAEKETGRVLKECLSLRDPVFQDMGHITDDSELEHA